MIKKAKLLFKYGAYILAMYEILEFAIKRLESVDPEKQEVLKDEPITEVHE